MKELKETEFVWNRCRFCPRKAAFLDKLDGNLYCSEHAKPFPENRLEKLKE